MKRVITIAVSVLAGFVLAVVLGVPPAVRAGGTPCASKNGDVNADGNIDLSDAVTILGNLFLGNPTELVPLCGSPPVASSLPVTGQTKCFDSSGVETPCDSANCPGQDGAHVTGCPSQGRFIAPGLRPDGTILDTCTGLMWQRDTADVKATGCLMAMTR